MKRSLLTITRMLTIGAFAFSASTVGAQCLTFEGGPYIDFVQMFDGAPCDDGTGCPVNEITDFEIWASEAYVMPGVQEGGTYIFSACNGVGGSAWPITFTILSPSETVDAFGTNDGSNCAITWTASESGQYLIIINEEGECGATNNPNEQVDNGFPSITCVSSPETVCGGVGIAEQILNGGFNVYPNPTEGIFTIEMANAGHGNAVVDVLDLSGRIVRTMNIPHGDQLLQVVNIQGEKSGAYMVRITLEDRVLTSSIMLTSH